MTLKLSRDFSKPGSRQTWIVRLADGSTLKTSSRSAAEQLLDSELSAMSIEDPSGRTLVTLSNTGEHVWHHVTDEERKVLRPEAINSKAINNAD